jgi:hypothetical protein
VLWFPYFPKNACYVGSTAPMVIMKASGNNLSAEANKKVAEMSKRNTVRSLVSTICLDGNQSPPVF